MPIDSRHPLYTANAARWQRCRDAYEGEDAVKAKRASYLPIPGGMEDSEYTAYLTRALFYEATGRTVDGFVGAIARKDPTVEVPAELEALVEDATTDGMSLAELSKQICAETILQGRGGLLVDYDEKLGRAYLSFYPTEAITNWFDGGVILHETVYEPDDEDHFKQNAIEQFRELAIINGVYTVNIWRLAQGANTQKEWVIYETLIPKRRGKSFDAVPFFWITPAGRTMRVEKPPLLGLVNVCLSHFRNSADLEHGRHFCGLPTLYITGAVETDGPIRVGGQGAIILTNPQATVGYAEFTGQGLGSLETALETKQAMMATLGAQIFHDGPKGVEAAETARIRTSGETSLLSGVVTAVEEMLEAAVQCAADWMSVSGTVEITLNRDWIDTTIDGPTLTGLVQAYQAGALSLPQFLYSLQQGELLAPDTDLEEEVKVVQAEVAQKAADAVKFALATKPVSKSGS